VYVRAVSGERYRWVVLAAGTLAQASFSALTLGVPALAPQLRSEYHLSLGQIGVVVGACGIGMLPTLLPWGLLADRVGERLVIAAGLTGAAAVAAGTAETTTFAGLAGLLAVAGALGASVNAASGRAVMGWFGVQERGLALGIRQTSIPIGAATAAASLPWLASTGGTHLAFLALAGGLLAGATLGATLLRDAPSREAPAPREKPPSPLRDPRMWRLGGGSALYLVAQISITGFVVLFLHEQRGLSPHSAAAILAGINVLGIGARIGAGRWSDRRGTRLRPLRTIGVALAAATAVVAALVDAPLKALLPALVICGVLGLAWNGLSFTAAAETAGAARSGGALGFQQMLLGVFVAFVPPAFAAVVAASSWRIAYACAVVGPAAGVLVLRGLRDPARATTDLRPERRRGRWASLQEAPRTRD
jgi:sugar phosphate permease